MSGHHPLPTAPGPTTDATDATDGTEAGDATNASANTADDAALALPSLDALVAGTVALMTAHARPCPGAHLPPAQLQQLLARKVVSNLFFLMQHPHAPAALRQSLAQAHASWQALVAEAASAAPAEPAASARVAEAPRWWH